MAASGSFYENEFIVNKVSKTFDKDGKVKRVLLTLENNDITKNLSNALKIFIEQYDIKIRK